MEVTLEEWTEYKDLHRKKYDSEEEETRRKKIYLENKKKIHEHNILYEKGEVTYKMGINQFTDMLPEEMKKMCGLRMGACGNIQS